MALDELPDGGGRAESEEGGDLAGVEEVGEGASHGVEFGGRGCGVGG